MTLAIRMFGQVMEDLLRLEKQQRKQWRRSSSQSLTGWITPGTPCSPPSYHSYNFSYSTY